jgi:hypothetical protein
MAFARESAARRKRVLGFIDDHVSLRGGLAVRRAAAVWPRLLRKGRHLPFVQKFSGLVIFSNATEVGWTKPV